MILLQLDDEPLGKPLGKSLGKLLGKPLCRPLGKLHHNNFNERSNKDTLVFGGVFSEYPESSNWAPAELYYNGVKHKSIEHAYMHTMAKHSRMKIQL